MDKVRRRARYLWTIAGVLGLHLTIIWLLLTAARQTAAEPKSQALEIVFYPRPPPSIQTRTTGRIAGNVAPGQRTKTNAEPHAAGPQAGENKDMPAPIDWAGELARTARDAVPEESAQKSREFGFPHGSAAPADKTPQFGWDYAATHRIESIPEGGLLVHLNDHCVLVLFPLPFAGCAIGKAKANGHLFDHMHELSPSSGEN